MRGLVWGVLAVTSCSAGVSPQPRVVPAPAPGLITATFQVERASAGSRIVDLAYVVAECTALQELVLNESAERVVIRLDLGGREGKDCTDPVRKHRRVTLAAPLGDRPVLDGGIVPPQPAEYASSTETKP